MGTVGRSCGFRREAEGVASWPNLGKTEARDRAGTEPREVLFLLLLAAPEPFNQAKYKISNEFTLLLLLLFVIFQWNHHPRFVLSIVHVMTRSNCVNTVGGGRGGGIHYHHRIESHLSMLLMSVFWMSTRTATAGSTLATSSTTIQADMKFRPLPIWKGRAEKAK